MYKILQSKQQTQSILFPLGTTQISSQMQTKFSTIYRSHFERN